MAFLPEPQTREEEIHEFALFLKEHYETIEKYLQRWAEELRERELAVEERERLLS